jgi:hypothetical protein
MPETFIRPELTEADLLRAAKISALIGAKAWRFEASRIINELACENMRLAKEVNVHRAHLGFEPLPVFTNEI